MNYAMISLSAVFFSLVFLFSDRYRARCGASSAAALRFAAGSHFAGLLILLVINRFRLEFTPFTLLVAAVAAGDVILFQVFSLKALGKTNLSQYSVFSMVGGMALPFLAGILFFREALTVGKVLCLLLVIAALALTAEKGGHGGAGYYIGVFLTNGLYGVINKFFSAAPYHKTSDAGYSILVEGLIAALCLVLLVFAKKQPENKGGHLYMAGYGSMSAVGNYFLLLALRTLPASAQYPFVTGGVMVLSTVYSFFTAQKPGKKELLSLLLAGLGIAALFLPR